MVDLNARSNMLSMAGDSPVPEHIAAVISTFPNGLLKAHERIIDRIRRAKENNRKIVVLSDGGDADGASAEAYRDIFKAIGHKNYEIRYVDRNNIAFDEPGVLYIVHDLTVEPKHTKDVAKGVEIINVDHHDNPIADHPALVVVANPFITDRPHEGKLSREESSPIYALNPSIQMLNLARLAGTEPAAFRRVELIAAIGAVGDRAHKYRREIADFVSAVARKHGMNVDTVSEVAELFSYPERFPRQVSHETVIRAIMGAIDSGDVSAALSHPVLAKYRQEWQRIIEKYRERVEREQFDHDERVSVGGHTVRLIVAHVDPEDERRVQKIKSEYGSMILEKYDGVKIPVIGAAGQWEPGDVLNYRVVVNDAAADVGFHAGEISRKLAEMFGLRGGGHQKVGGAVIPYSERPHAHRHFKKAINELYGKQVG